MEIREKLLGLGFDRVEVLDGAECGIEARRLILCFAFYEAAAPGTEVSGAAEEISAERAGEGEEGLRAEAVIHPYYPVSQRAYREARAFVEGCEERGIRVRQENGIHIKRILNRMPMLRRGRNTLAYLPEVGSRFHVQILTAEEEIPVTVRLEAEEHGVGCGSCRRCMEACPGGAIREDGFEKEQCIRYWMMNGRMPPEEIAEKMGNRLMGCDACEACCPMNREGRGEAERIALETLLAGEERSWLAERIGRNYAIRNRVVTQGCLIAGSLRSREMKDSVERVKKESASPVVWEAAEWALGRM